MRRAAAAVGVLLLFAVAACGDREAELSRADVEEIIQTKLAEAAAAEQPAPALSEAEVQRIVRAELAEAPVAEQPEPGLSEAEVRRVVRDAQDAIPTQEPGISAEDVERIARGVLDAIPLKSAPAEYTKFLVDNAIRMYESRGLDATLAHYNHEGSVDGQWYVFIIDENGLVIGHPDPGRVGLDLKGWVGTDINGYHFGPEMVAATEEGKWVSYVYRNLQGRGLGSDNFELKNVWVVRHDGLRFASGWYIHADEFTQLLVQTAVDKFKEGGLEATVQYFARPGSVLAGLESAIDYYNSADNVRGQWFAFIADHSGRIAAHSEPFVIGKDLVDTFGPEILAASPYGNWVTTKSLRVWVIKHDGWLLGSGWRHDI